MKEDTTVPETTRAGLNPAAADVVVPGSTVSRSFLLQRVQPAMTGLIDGSLSTLAPIFSVAIATHEPHTAFLAGTATALGAGVSMAFSEGLSDTGALTGRGNPYVRGAITGSGTFLGGILHTLPFLIPQYRVALVAAVLVIAIELLTLATLRWRLFQTPFLFSFASITHHRWPQRGTGERRLEAQSHECPSPRWARGQEQCPA